MPPQVWKKLELRRVKLQQGPKLEQLGLVLVPGKQRLELVLGLQLQEMQRELLPLGLLLQHLLGVMLLLQLLLTLEKMRMRKRRQWQGLMMEMKLGMASRICSVQSFLSCTLRCYKRCQTVRRIASHRKGNHLPLELCPALLV